MKLTIIIEVNPQDYGRSDDEQSGVVIAHAFYNCYTDPPPTAKVRVNESNVEHDLILN